MSCGFEDARGQFGRGTVRAVQCPSGAHIRAWQGDRSLTNAAQPPAVDESYMILSVNSLAACEQPAVF